MLFPTSWLGVLALVVLVSATMGGVLTAVMLLADKNLPVDLGLVHGRAGVIGIVLLLSVIILGVETGASLKPVLGVYILTALGGAILYFLIRRKGLVPRLVIFAHGAFAVAALATLLFGLPL